MKVIIVGGGIAGLTLANALERADIDFVLLEARALIDPQVGASIAILAGGLRIFDQFGAADEIISQTMPIQWVTHHNADGSLISPPDTAPQLQDARFGYAASILDRQLVLRALANSIKQQGKILLNKRLASVEHSEAGVTVRCEDGTSHDGDLVVGCDGVNSKARDCMWQLASKADPSYFPESEQSKMSAEYSCLFGISNAVKGTVVGNLDYTYDRGTSFMVLTGKNGRIFWFFFQKLDRKYYWHEKDFPKYTKADAEKVAADNAWRKCHETLSFGDIWEQRVTYTLVPMEEALFKKWHWGRIATIGDNAHKMTANHGQAGNNAIESAVALANQLKRIHDSNDASFTSIRLALTAWQAKRQARIHVNWQAAADVCRMHTLAGVKEWIIVYLLIPNAPSMLAEMLTDAIIGSEILEYLPYPKKSVTGTCPFNPQAGVGFKESLARRALTASPLLAISAAVVYFNNGNAAASASLLTPPTAPRTTSFAADAGVLYALWLLEASRRANALTLAQLAPLFALLAQFSSIALIAPLYYFAHYTTATLDKFGPADMRLTNIGYTRTVLPVLLALVYVPWLWLSHTEASSPTANTSLVRGAALALPVIVSVVQRLLVWTGVSPDTEKQDALNDLTRDVPHLRACAYVLSTLAGAAWLWAAYTSYPAILTTTPSSSFSYPGNTSHLALSVSSLSWVALLVADLYSAGMLQRREVWGFVGWGLLVAGMGGPGAAVGCVWVWRETVLVTVRRTGAVVVAGKGVGEGPGRDLKVRR